MSAGCNPYLTGTVANCSGGAGSGSALFEYWCQFSCPQTYSIALNTNSNGLLGYNSANLPILQQNILQLFNTYNSTNSITDNISAPGYSTFQNELLNLCLNPQLPGICNEALTSYCTAFTRNQVAASPILRSFCGCYAAPDPTILSATQQPSCDPICNLASTVQKADATTGTFLTCPDNICVINNVTIDVANSNIPNGVNFSNICPACGSGSGIGGGGGGSGSGSGSTNTGATGNNGCICVVAGANVSQQFSKVGVINTTQYCSGASVCITEDSAGNIISSGPCPSNPGLPAVPTYSSFPSIWLIILFVVLFLIVIMFLISINSGVGGSGSGVGSKGGGSESKDGNDNKNKK